MSCAVVVVVHCRRYAMLIVVDLVNEAIHLAMILSKLLSVTEGILILQVPNDWAQCMQTADEKS